MSEISIKGKTFYDKTARLAQSCWGTSPEQTQFAALLFNLGVVKDETSQPKTSQLHLWLLSYEFSETVLVLTKDKIAVLTSKRKKVLLEEMEVPPGYEGPALSVTLRDPNADNQASNFNAFLADAFGRGRPSGPIGIFSGEQVQGAFS